MNFKVMYGTLLGDGNIQFYENKNYYAFNLSQSEKEYLIWKCNMCAVKYRYYNEPQRKPTYFSRWMNLVLCISEGANSDGS